MTAPTPRQAALERLYAAVKAVERFRDGTDVDYPLGAYSERERELVEVQASALAAVEQAAPERPRCSACGELWSHHGNPNRCPRQELADARAAIRLADELITPDTVSERLRERWLRMPAVVAALKEEPPHAD